MKSLRLVRAACVLALVALALIVWPAFDPRPVPVVVAMSLGQALGTVSFLCFIVVVARDLRVRLREKRPDDCTAKPS
jgi:hypothetical protein